MRVHRWLMVVALALPVSAGCYEARISNPDLWFLDVPVDTATPDEGPADPGVTDNVVVDTVVVDTATDTATDTPKDTALPDTNRTTGAPCEEDGQCWTSMCLTTAFLQLLNPNLEAPGGMCSLLYCSADTECGEGDGSICLDASALSEGVTLCAKPCGADADCRDLYVCPDIGAKDGQGNAVKTCLPRSMVELLVCDQGKCAADPKDPYCPAACPL
jgi:hypothetical protein